MSTQKSIRSFLLVALILLLLGPVQPAFAWSGCGASYIVQPGDTLGGIAQLCGTTIAALRLANPNLGWWIYAGQTLWLPGAQWNNGNGYLTYIVARGDTLKSIAARVGTTMAVLASLNGISNINLIYEGQWLTVPTRSAPAPAPGPGLSSAGTYIVQWGDTMRKIADHMGVSLADLIAVNPQIWNPNLIFFGQVINVPASASLYTIQRGDTLKIIAARFGTTVDRLLALNPQIWNPDWIFAGQVIRVW